jgi:lipopolysaccharide/colanic/teichoic acid biosynthesis glycosyltransferase
MLGKRQRVLKRLFDLSFSILLLPFAIFPLILMLLIAWFSTGESGLFVQERIGRFGKHFKLFKIRSLKGKWHNDAHEIQQNETSFGRWIRKSKLDELPQLFNVLNGDMSWVGPRPDLPGYADKLQGDDQIILKVRPGITGPATIKYKNEDALLLQQTNPNWYNDHVIWPDKVRINKDYIANWSFKKDLFYLMSSIFNVK